MENLLDPAILFFVFGMLAGCVKSNLEIPQPIARFLSLYLLMALGLKGGFALAESGLTRDVAASLGSAVGLAVLVPLLGWFILRRWLPPFDAVAVAATYGSVSAVTFITAVQVLEERGVPTGGHMAAAMALMESPAIIMAVLMANVLRAQGLRTAGGVPAGLVVGTSAAASGAAVLSAGGPGGVGVGPGWTSPTGHPGGVPLKRVLHESFTDGAQLLLLGAMAVGLITGESGAAAMKPFTGDLFKGLLAFFLLDMGLTTARHFSAIRDLPKALVAWGLAAPVMHASLALALAWALRLPVGDAALLMVLGASASYIAVPAVLRQAIPEARPALYFGLSLGITFPFNILFGIPLILQAAQFTLG